IAAIGPVDRTPGRGFATLPSALAVMAHNLDLLLGAIGKDRQRPHRLRPGWTGAGSSMLDHQRGLARRQPLDRRQYPGRVLARGHAGKERAALVADPSACLSQCPGYRTTGLNPDIVPLVERELALVGSNPWQRSGL